MCDFKLKREGKVVPNGADNHDGCLLDIADAATKVYNVVLCDGFSIDLDFTDGGFLKAVEEPEETGFSTSRRALNEGEVAAFQGQVEILKEGRFTGVLKGEIFEFEFHSLTQTDYGSVLYIVYIPYYEVPRDNRGKTGEL